MKGKLGKTGIISLALVIALAGLGAAFAHWTETLTTEANVSTGELKLELTNIQCTDNEPLLGLEDVGHITCPDEPADEGSDFTTFTLSITNAYPGYVGTANFKIENTGSIPAYIYDCKYSPVIPPGIPYWAHIDVNDVLNCGGKYIDPEEKSPEFHITVTISESGNGVECQEDYTFKFIVTIKAMQWNYAP